LSASLNTDLTIEMAHSTWPPEFWHQQQDSVGWLQNQDLRPWD